MDYKDCAKRLLTHEDILIVTHKNPDGDTASCAAALVQPISLSMALVLLVIVVLMQASVNTFNDYYDYVKGTDSEDDNVDASDAVLVYNNVNPNSALALAVGMLGDDLQSSVLINYLKRYTKQALKLFVDIDNDAMLHKVLNFSFLQDEIDACFDEVFDYANRKGNVKAKAVLMNHRNVSGGYEDPTDEFEL